MRRVSSIAVIAGAGVGLWLLTRARAEAVAEFDELVDTAEQIEERAREHKEAADAYDPEKQTEDAWREQLPEHRDFLDEALDRGGVWWRPADPSGLHGTGYETGAPADPEDRATVAALECARAAELGLIPRDRVAECARELDAHPQGIWNYTAPGSRAGVRVYIGPFGHPSYQPR